MNRRSAMMRPLLLILFLCFGGCTRIATDLQPDTSYKVEWERQEQYQRDLIQLCLDKGGVPIRALYNVKLEDCKFP